MSDKKRQPSSRVPANRHYAEAMQALESAGSPHVIPIKEYVRRLRDEARRYRIKARTLAAQQEGAQHGH